ncbi:MAG: hypothetical protein ACT4PQ_06030 [Betaproteobacteria bacterium]
MNVGMFIAAAVLLDFALWLFILLGWESVLIPANFASTHQPEFVFPYSHSLAASLAWSATAGAAAFFWYTPLEAGKWRAAALIAAAVFSHWLLDALVHQPGLPVTGANSPKLGLGLWQSLPVALAVETAIVVAGLLLFVRGSRMSRGKSIVLISLSVIVLVFTVVGMTIAPSPPSALAMAGSSLVTLLVVCAFACWLGKLPRERQA